MIVYVSICQVGDIILEYICFFFLVGGVKLVTVCVLILPDLGRYECNLKKAKWKRKRRGKSANDQILSKSETDQFHNFLKLIKVGGNRGASQNSGEKVLAPSTPLRRIATVFRYMCVRTFTKLNFV